MELLRTILNSDRDARAIPMPATFAGRYLVECAVAGGAASVVWRAKEISTGVPVALKFFPPEIVGGAHELLAVQQLVHQARACSHPGVAAPTEVLVAGEYAAIVTPWIEGPTMRQMMYARPKRFFEVDELRRWLQGVIDAVAAAHACGLVHGALNPDVIIQQAGEMRVIGWGVNAWLRRALGPGEPHDGHAEEVYLSPAQRCDEMPRASDDVYSLGVLIYHLLTGTPPSGGWLRRRPLPLARQRRKNGRMGDKIPPMWERTIRRCLEPSARDRFGSLGELRRWLELEPPVAPAPAAAPAAQVPESGPQVASLPASAPGRPGLQSPLSGDSEFAAPAPAMSRAVPPVESSPAPGRWALQSLRAMVTLAVLVLGGWLAWRLVQRVEFRAVVSELRPGTLPADDSPPPVREAPTPVPEAAVDRTAVAANREPPLPREPATASAPERVLVEETPIAPPDSGETPVPVSPPVEVTAALTPSSSGETSGAAVAVESPAPAPKEATGEIAGEGGQDNTAQAESDPVLSQDNGNAGDSMVTAVPRADLPASDAISSATSGPVPVDAPPVPPGDVAPPPAPASPPVATIEDMTPPAGTDPGVTTTMAGFSADAPVTAPLKAENDGNGNAQPAEVRQAKTADDNLLTGEPGRALPSDDAPASMHDEPVVAPAIGPPLDGGIWELDDVDVAPRLVERVDPVVPRRHFRSAARAHIELVVVIDRMGRVASASVHQTTDESLVAPSLQAVRRWRFSPASKHGKAVPVRVAVPLSFQTS